MKSTQQIYMVDALCGAGKTYSAIQFAIKQAEAGERIAIVQPTRELSKQSYWDCYTEVKQNQSNITVTIINSDTSDDVKIDVMKHLSAPVHHGEILFITHWTWDFVCGADWPKKQDWTLIIDEVPSIEKEFSVNVPDHHGVITNRLDMEKPDASGYAVLKPKTYMSEAVEHMALNRDDDEVSYVFRELATWLISKHWEVNVLADSYNKLVTQNLKKLTAFAVLDPSVVDGFKSVTIMGALFTDTPLYIIWSQLNVNFEPHPNIQGTRFSEHSNGAFIEFRYMHDRNLSKKLDNAHNVIDKMAIDVMADVANDNLLWVANKGVKDSAFSKMEERQIRLSNAPHGINKYQHVHNIAFLSAVNYSPAHGKFLEALGFDSDALKRAVALQVTYQAMMRSSIRNPDDTSPKTVYVFDKQIAVWLQEKFSGSIINQMPGQIALPQGKVGRPPKPIKSPPQIRAARAKRQQVYRAKKKAKK